MVFFIPERTMLKEVSGDILLSKAQAIAHGVAPDDHFNQGLALSLREQYPSMAKDFRHYCQVSHPKPGEVWAWAGADGKRVINLLTQEAAKSKQSHPGKATSHNVNVALRNLRKLAEDEKFTSIALPKLATGVGGLDWAEVKTLIENHLGDLDIPVYLYTTYHKGESGE
jgi:O-acetyl-ADP-ribose deacetylase (regulator of RNase III)